jgi:NAD(P)-dependent dehydrogenase (short-subunit alcohol dehydrogenase family)
MSRRHVLVTGAASGIGKRTAQRFAEAGDAVSLVDFRPDALEAARTEIAAAGGEVLAAIQADLREPEAAEKIITDAWRQAPVDVLVNAAGVYPATPFLDLDAVTWDSVLDLNLRAPLLTTVAIARRAIAEHRKPTVVNITSGSALRARPGAAPYSTSKAALEMTTRASALELGQYGIRVNAVSPGFVEVGSSVNRVTDEYAAAVSPNPLGRIGEPDDIARAVYWIAGDDADWVTGTVLRVDGGSSTGAMGLPLSWPTTGATTADHTQN